MDMSSIAPGTSQEIAAALSEKAIEMLDAPVSGGEPKAIDGTLSVMVGGKQEIFEQVKDLLLCMGSSAVYCGGLAGSTVMNAKVPMMLAGNAEPGFRIGLHIKDLNNVTETAREIEMDIPLTGQVMEMMQTLKTEGWEEKDHSALVQYYTKMTGTSLVEE